MSELCTYCLDQLDGVIAEGTGSFGLCKECDSIDPDELTRIIAQRKAETESRLERATRDDFMTRKMNHDSILNAFVHYDAGRLERWRKLIDPMWTSDASSVPVTKRIEETAEDIEITKPYVEGCGACERSSLAFREDGEGWATICHEHYESGKPSHIR